MPDPETQGPSAREMSNEELAMILDEFRHSTASNARWNRYVTEAARRLRALDRTANVCRELVRMIAPAQEKGDG